MKTLPFISAASPGAVQLCLPRGTPSPKLRKSFFKVLAKQELQKQWSTKAIIKCQDSDLYGGRKLNISLQMCISRSNLTQFYNKNRNYSEVGTKLMWLSYVTVEGEAGSQYFPPSIQYLFVNFHEKWEFFLHKWMTNLMSTVKLHKCCIILQIHLMFNNVLLPAT